MAPYYKVLCTKFSWDFDEKFYDEMKESNDKSLSEIQAKLDEAGERFGDMEILDAMFDRARVVLSNW